MGGNHGDGGVTCTEPQGVKGSEIVSVGIKHQQEKHSPKPKQQQRQTQVLS